MAFGAAFAFFMAFIAGAAALAALFIAMMVEVRVDEGFEMNWTEPNYQTYTLTKLHGNKDQRKTTGI